MFVIVRQEHQAGGVVRAQGDARFVRERAQEGIGVSDQQAATVATEPVGRDAAAMGHARQGVDRAIHQCTAGTIVELCDQAKAAGIALVAGVVKTDGGGAVLLIHRYSRQETVDNET